MRHADVQSNLNTSYQGPNPTTFGPLTLLGRSPAGAIITGVIAVALYLLMFDFATPERPQVVWMMLVFGLIIGYLTQRRRSRRPGLQIGLSTALPLAITIFFVFVSRDAESTVGSLALVPATVMGHLLARLAERLFGPRKKVMLAMWAGIERVGAAEHSGEVSFDIRALVGPGAKVTKQEAQDFSPYVRNSSLRVRSTVFKWLFIIAAPIITITLLVGFADEATKGGDDVQAQLVGFSAVAALLILAYGVIAWFGFRGSRHATSLQDHVRFARFARANGFEYDAGPRGDRFGRELSRIMRADQGRRWALANVTRAMQLPGESSAASTFFSGVCEVQMRVPLPNLLLISRRVKLPAFSSHSAPQPDQKLTLEGDFNRYFDLYCPAGYERDALYILTPDVMARLIDGARDFDVEFIDDRLVLRSRKDLVSRDPAQWQRIATAVNALSDRVEQWGRWRDDRHESPGTSVRERLITEKPTGVAKAGQRLRGTLSWGGLLTLAFGAVYVALVFLSNSL